MNLQEVRTAIRQVIAEEMKKGGLPKSGGKLVHLKKELAGLKKMKESLGQYQIAEGGETSSFVAEYAHMQKFVNELEKIKAAHSKLAEMLDTQISEVEGKVASETEKIKEMMGLIEKAKKEPKAKSEKKADKKEDEKKDDKKKAKKLNEGETVKTKYGNLNITQDEDGWGYFFNWEKGGVKQGVQNYDFPSKEEAIKDFEKAMAQEKSFR